MEFCFLIIMHRILMVQSLQLYATYAYAGPRINNSKFVDTWDDD